MNTSMRALALLGILFVIGTGQAQTAATKSSASSIKVGLWETTTVTEDKAAGSSHSVVGRACLEAAEVSNLARIVPAQREFGMQCENRDLKQDGTNVVWVISCKSSDATLLGKGRMSFFGDSYLGTADVERRKQGSKPVKLTQSFSGKWVQACS